MPAGDKAALRSAVRRDWPADTPGARLFEALVTLPVGATRRLTLSFLRRLTHLSSLEEVRGAAEYFATRLPLLEPCYALQLDAHTERPLSREQFYRAIAEGMLVDPETGEDVPDWRERVIVYYQGSERLVRVLGGPAR
jgi:hypothetical protein